MTISKFTLIVGLGLTLNCTLLIAQKKPDQKKTISLSELMEMIISPSDQEVLIEKKRVKIKNPALLKRNGLVKYLSEKYPDLVNSKGNITLTNNLTLRDCRFFEEINFHKIDFAGGLTIKGSRIASISISDSDSKKITFYNNKVAKAIEFSELITNAIELHHNELGDFISINNCTIGNELKINNNVIKKGEIRLIGSKIDQGSLLLGDNTVVAEIMENCEISLSPNSEFNHFRLPGMRAADLYLISNDFKGDSTTRVVFNKANYLNLDISNNTFRENVYFLENKIAERFTLVDNTFEKFVSFEKFLFSEIWNELYWDQLAGYKLRYQDYAASKPEDYDQINDYHNLINVYKSMHNIFSSRGDLESANACYSEMKELQGQMHKHIYQLDPTFGNFLRWQLNVLLKVYTNHGTDPGLAVVMSFYVIVLFSLLYVFFPSEWDKGRQAKLSASFANLRTFNKGQIFSSLFVITTSLAITLINAITLSINSFVTLGFGSIPTNGFGRYLCIIEGFIGWFLLSIFSVALINQVLA